MTLFRTVVATVGILSAGMGGGVRVAVAQERPAAPQPGARPGPRPPPEAPAARGGAAQWAGDGSFALADGRRLVFRGLILPTRLAVTEGLPAAAAAAAGPVLAGAEVRPAALHTDRHGRLVGDALLLRPGAPPSHLAAALLAAGAGYADPAQAPGCPLAAAEAEARQAGRGIWTLPGAKADARDVAGLSRRVGLFSLVEGRVTAAGATRDRVFLNFGERWREDFTVILAKEDFATIFGEGLPPARLAGRWIRVRGVVRLDGGPAISVAKAGQLDDLPGLDER